MLYFIVVWTGLLAIFLTAGCGWLHWLRGGVIVRSADRIIAAIWLGLVGMAISMLGLAIFVPLSPLAGIAVTLLWLLLAMKSQAVRTELKHWASNLSAKLLLGYGLCSVAVAAFISQQVTFIDAGQYHYGFIHWFSEYGLPPGLALINPQFGFVSAWFAIAAPFDFAVFEGRVSPIMNGFILLVAAVQIAIALKRIALGRALLSDWFSLIFLLVVSTLLARTLLLSDITISPSPDSAIALLTVAVAWSMLVVSRSKIASTEGVMSADLIPLVLSVGAVSIKLTALPLLAITAGFYLFNGTGPKINLRNYLKRSVIASLVILLLLWPFLASEVVVSGCPLYPSTVACLDLPWTPSAAATQDLAEDTHGWGRWFDQAPNGVNRSLWLLYQWILRGPSNKLIAVLIFASICSAVYLLRSLRMNKQPVGQLYSLFWLTALAIVGTAFMMLKAPIFRFGMSYALLLPVLSISVLFNAWTQQRSGYLMPKYLMQPLRKSEYSLLFVGALWAIALSSHAYSDMGDRLLIAPPLPPVALKVQESNQITYFVSQDRRNRCWAADLPCVITVRSDVELRNPSAGIKGGFILDESL
ncbi:MAG: hypothetical protein WBB01_21770 [Phormidesmis sp.]